MHYTYIYIHYEYIYIHYEYIYIHYIYIYIHYIYTYIHHIYIYMHYTMTRCTYIQGSEDDKMPYFDSLFPQKRPIISGSFAERDLQLKASNASFSPCTSSSIKMYIYMYVCRYMHPKNLFVYTQPYIFT